MKIKRFYLEITNACNLDCPFCTNNKGQSFMSLKEIKDYLSQIKEFSDYVYLHVLGEPLLHPDLDSILNITDKLNLNVQLVTNGTLLDSKMFIFNHKSLRKLSISIHSLNYSKIDNDYFDTINKIIELDTSTYIELRFYDYENLNDEIKAFRDALYFKYNIDKTAKNNSFRLKENVFIYYAKMFNWPSINDPYISSVGKCHGAIDQLAVLHDGTLTLCCLDSNGHNQIGNLKNTKLKEILNSKEYLNIVENFKNKKLTKELCTKCAYRLRFDDTNNSKQ